MSDTSVSLNVFGSVHALSHSRVRALLQSELQNRVDANSAFPSRWILTAPGEPQQSVFLLYASQTRLFAAADTAWRLVHWIRSVPPCSSFPSPPKAA